MRTGKRAARTVSGKVLLRSVLSINYFWEGFVSEIKSPISVLYCVDQFLVPLTNYAGGGSNKRQWFYTNVLGSRPTKSGETSHFIFPKRPQKVLPSSAGSGSGSTSSRSSGSARTSKGCGKNRERILVVHRTTSLCTLQSAVDN